MTDVALVRPSNPPATATEAAGPEAPGQTFAPGWDRQDRWLRFVDPALERSYRAGMTPAARRRFRIAAAIGCAIWAIQPVQIALLFGRSLGPAYWSAGVILIAVVVAAMVWAGRAGLLGIWGLSCLASAIYALGIVLTTVEIGTFSQVAAVGLASLGIFQIAWIRVAWWVAAAMGVTGVILFVIVAVAHGDDAAAVNQAFFLAATLGGATGGSWFLEAAERRSFAQGLLVDHLYRRVDRLFRSYLSPDVAEALVTEPARAELGGEVAEVSVLFADLRDYTPFAEGRSPVDVVAMLNQAFGAAVPAVFAEGGTIVSFVGDALMAIFNAPLRQPDHALRACRAGLALQAAIGSDAATDGHPRFRVGINTGPALVGNIGSPELRNFSALGDTTNTAARLQTYAPEGSVVIGERTYELVGDAADLRCLGPVELKGKATPTMAFELLGLREVEVAERPAALPTGAAMACGARTRHGSDG